MARRSAPWMSLANTLPVRTVSVSDAVCALESLRAWGTSSTTLMSSEPLATSPLLSLADTVMLSLTLLAPLPSGWLSVPSRV
ncbi:hypothetical protein D3C81_1990990 [compost metagenome]